VHTALEGEVHVLITASRMKQLQQEIEILSNEVVAKEARLREYEPQSQIPSSETTEPQPSSTPLQQQQQQQLLEDEPGYKREFS